MEVKSMHYLKETEVCGLLAEVAQLDPCSTKVSQCCGYIMDADHLCDMCVFEYTMY